MKTLLRLFSFLRHDWFNVVLSVLLGVATIGSGIGLMGASAYIIATAALHPSIAVLQVAIVGVRFFGISRGVFRYLERLVSHSLNFDLLAKLRVWLFRAIEPLAPGGLLRYQSGDVLTRMVGDIETLENFYVRVVAPPVVALIVVLGVSILVGSAHVGFTVILLTGLLVSGGLIPYLHNRLNRKASQENVLARAELATKIIDGLQGSTELTVFDQKRTFIKQLEKLAKRTSHIQITLVRHHASSSAINLLVTNLTLWGVVAFGIACVDLRILDGVTLAVLALVTLASFEAVLPLNQAAQSFESSLQAGKRLFELADQTPLIRFADVALEQPTSGGVEFKDVSFRYNDDQAWVISNLNFHVGAGEHVALVGESGAGKTTLLYLIQRFWDPTEGEILLGGMDIKRLSEKTIRGHVSLMTQSTFVFDDTLKQNLLIAKPNASERELWEALEKARLEVWAKNLPLGLDTWLGESGQKMSGGERQRLAIARLHLRDSQIVLLDEPTSHLDAPTAHEIREILFSTFYNRTIIWITHEQADLLWFDRILKLEGGTITGGQPRN